MDSRPDPAHRFERNLECLDSDQMLCYCRSNRDWGSGQFSSAEWLWDEESLWVTPRSGLCDIFEGGSHSALA